MQSNHLCNKILSICILILFCFSCTAAADTAETIAEKIRQAKVDAYRFQQELSDEIDHIHDELAAQATPTPGPASVSSVQAVENADFVQMLRNDLSVITDINAARAVNAAQEAVLFDAIEQFEDEESRRSYNSRLEKLSSARLGHEEKAGELLSRLTTLIQEADPEFPVLTLTATYEHLNSWTNEFHTYIRNNPYSLKNHSFTSVQDTFSELRILLSGMDSLSEELTALEMELLAL